MSLSIWISGPVDDGHINGPRVQTLWSWDPTHNLIPMWRKAGCLDALYESHGKRAGDVVEELRRGLEAMRADPEGFRALNPSNGWGDYDRVLPYLVDCVEAFTNYPNAIIGVSR